MALAKLFLHFTRRGAKACAISLPPNFHPAPFDDEHFYEQMQFHGFHDLAPGVFWMIAEFCREFRLPFDLMIGVNRRVYEKGVYQGQDLFDQRTSLLQYKDLFNAFPDVTFPISVLTSGQNQELVAYSWIFPNVLPNGHWWYSNTPPYIAKDLTERITAVPKTKLIGYYSDAYKLEFVLPKYAMYRRILANVLADEFVRPGVLEREGRRRARHAAASRQRPRSLQGVALRHWALCGRFEIFCGVFQQFWTSFRSVSAKIRVV